MLKRDTGAGFALLALHLQPAVTTIKALRYCWRRLCRSVKAFHSQRPCVSFGAIRLTDGFICPFTGMPRMDFRTPNAITEYALSRWAAHGRITAALAATGNPTRI
jgi:hypothetical protein